LRSRKMWHKWMFRYDIKALMLLDKTIKHLSNQNWGNKITKFECMLLWNSTIVYTMCLYNIWYHSNVHINPLKPSSFPPFFIKVNILVFLTLWDKFQFNFKLEVKKNDFSVMSCCYIYDMTDKKLRFNNILDIGQ